MRKIEICPGLTMPFFPMRPVAGRTLRTPKLVREFIDEFDPEYWEMQPKLNGDRVCLATARGRVYAQNRHGGWYQFPISNAKTFLSLGDGFCLDGEVHQGSFYPFDTLAQSGVLCFDWPTYERVALARKLAVDLQQPWLFDAPKPEWLMVRQKNMPQWEGIVLKRKQSGYMRLGSADAGSLVWMKRRWDNRKQV